MTTAPPRLLMASPNDWDSPFQVGSHHLARGFVRAGWRVAYLSDPISPWHLGRGLTADLRRRLALYRAGGRHDLGGRLWAYVPAALVVPHRWPVLRTGWVHRHWFRLTLPDLARLVRRRGFGTVDLLYLDSVYQSFWLDVIDHRRAVYRVADYNPQYEKYTAATRNAERELARRVDLVAYCSPELKDYVDDLGIRRSLYLPNGVDYEHFARGPTAPPPEYRGLSRPIAVYLGVIPAWFHFDWLREAAERLPGMSFVLIGPEDLARERLGGLANVHLLGRRPYAAVPAYLQHADVGLMPFDVRSNARAVDALTPQKLYAYLAAGLPVVLVTWKAIRQLDAPVRLCRTADEFVAALRRAAADRGDVETYRRYAARFDWTGRVTTLLQALEALGRPADMQSAA